MYKQEHIEAASWFLEHTALGTCMSDDELIDVFIKSMPELAEEFNFNEDYEICDLLASPEVVEASDVIRCVGCWWFVRLSECTEVAGEDFCEDCAGE